jgi:hypothetical protein
VFKDKILGPQNSGFAMDMKHYDVRLSAMSTLHTKHGLDLRERERERERRIET